MYLDEEKRDPLVHVHFIHRHVPEAISFVFLAILTITVGVLVYLYATKNNDVRIVISGADNKKEDFVYGSWPALENAKFFKKTKDDFISQGASFIEADLSAMAIRFYNEGELIKEAPIQTKGRDGSWWETPAGLYKISIKEQSHFSSFGRVYMPWSMQFQGNFFIHGPTHYPDGSPTSSSYSGGCIRIALDDAEEIYRLAQIGTPVLVFESSFGGESGVLNYTNKNVLPRETVYLIADLENNFVFVENKSREKNSIASITKLMSALISVEYINVEKEVSISQYMLASTSIARLQEGERISVLDILSLLLQESSNEAALAITAPLGEKYFIKLMNIKAGAIGMKNSTFVDTSGVLAGNTSTAEDLFHLAKYLYYNRSFVLHMSMGRESRAVYGPPRYSSLQNLNLIHGAEELIGAKVGLSSSAGDSMLAVFETVIDGENRPIVIIVLGSDDAKRDAATLLKYAKNNFSLE